MDSRYNGYSDDGRIDTHSSVVPYNPNTPTHSTTPRRGIPTRSVSQSATSAYDEPSDTGVGRLFAGTHALRPLSPRLQPAHRFTAPVSSRIPYTVRRQKSRMTCTFAYSQNITPPRICRSGSNYVIQRIESLFGMPVFSEMQGTPNRLRVICVCLHLVALFSKI